MGTSWKSVENNIFIKDLEQLENLWPCVDASQIMEPSHHPIVSNETAVRVYYQSPSYVEKL